MNGPVNSVDPDITVSEWVEVYKSTYRKSINPAYIACDNIPYNRLVKKLGTMRVVDIREHHLQDAVEDVSGMSFSTVNKYMQAIKRVFHRAKKNKIIDDDPAEDLKMPLYTEGTHRALEAWEVQHILSNWDNPYARAGIWIMLMLLCGLRRGEMMALEWDSINLSARTLEVRQVAVVMGNKRIVEQRAKSDAGLRTLPMPKLLCDALETVPPEERIGFVCLGAHGEPLTESSSKRGMQRFCCVLERLLNGEQPDQRGRRHDIEDEPKEEDKERIPFSFTAHDLRHTYATALYDAGVDVKAAQYFLGHSDIKITLSLYTHLSRERERESQRQAISYLDQWLDGRTIRNVPFMLSEHEKTT